MRNIKTYESFVFESAEVELESNKLQQAKLVDQIKTAQQLIKKTDADKNKKLAQKETIKSAQTRQISQLNAKIAKLQQRQSQLISNIAKEKARM